MKPGTTKIYPEEPIGDITGDGIMDYAHGEPFETKASYTADEEARIKTNCMELSKFAKMIEIDTSKTAEQIETDDELAEVVYSLASLEEAGILTADEAEEYLALYKEKKK